MLSTFPYYGGRFYQLKEIMGILDKHKDQFDVVVDVFGGSGKVLINVPEEWRKVKVYNDINKDLYTTFKVLQNERKYRLLERKLRNAFPHEEIFKELRFSKPKSDVDKAFKTIYLHTLSYAGTGTAFKRFYQKATVHSLRLDHRLSFKKWIVENTDFRVLLVRYNKPKVLLYLDPPYLDGGKTYKYRFKMNDFLDLKALLDKHQGTYMLNLSMHDKQMLDIFGNPNMVTDHYRPTTRGTYDEGSRWECGYWWRF
jgi:DNA adenine methylase